MGPTTATELKGLRSYGSALQYFDYRHFFVSSAGAREVFEAKATIAH